VSSHAIALERVGALRFDVAAFSNLSQDHLDFHGSMAEYGAVKERLFDELSPRSSVVNVDDAFGKELAKRAQGTVVTVSGHTEASVSARSSEFGLAGIRAELVVFGRLLELRSRLVGAHNLENLLLSLGVLIALGEDAEAALAALAEVDAAPGRLERCDEPEDQRLVVVDYAHTPDALVRVLAALRPLTTGRLLCVFGCGGDRDPAKRPLMGRAVAEGADFAVVTNDNPRSENPQAIAQAILPPLIDSGTSHAVELDRRAAIELAISRSLPGDTVLIAGKGHEHYQIFGQQKRPFDDRIEARRALAQLRPGRAG
jgi:UDP-N-acetylmuramoyl-L-alanyl-D-glutamate--2,6-diaminopimelate ligase